ncbi:hypothetical protein GCM10009584_20600 [Ornithinimicrobium humiphilum]|uniref:Uncharacterized protein n=1 Tax=Ornithinimicrobium humiphilum TaxID=125288 RepID=A0A543KNJ6_9MICO|nr:hypothetical protein [Ornithinimicrobium humiphilum]TQM96641.1 hypothetical protein FB476_1526 [Ornithinimicrobium humiphilum]
MPEAEDAAWAQLEAIRSCPTGHSTFETRGYRNGLGFCTDWGMSRSGAFDVREVGHPCSVCGVGCFYSQRGEEWFCEEHAPARDEEDLFGQEG